jgi:hypothetical protein
MIDFLSFDLSAKLAISGLVLDLIGISILFLYQVDRNHALSEAGQYLIARVEGVDQKSVVWAKYRRRTILGFLLLILGFFLQLIGMVVAQVGL